MKTSQTSAPEFSLAHLVAFQENFHAHSAAGANFIEDELVRLRRKYATLLGLYHQAQMVDTEGLLTITLQSLTQNVTLALPDFDFWNAIMEPLLGQLSGLERQILAMTADLPARLEDAGSYPESAPILALCLPPVTTPAETHLPARCPFLPDATVAPRNVQRQAALVG